MSLKKQAISGVKWTTLSTIINSLVQIIQLAILARYLTPDIFGMIAIIMLVIGFSQMFVDFGVSSAIIHKQEISTEQLSTLYWLNIFISIVIFGLIVFLSPIIADFYNDASLSNLIILTSITIIIQSFGKQFYVLFEKELQFKIIAKIDIFAAISGLVFSIVLVINDYGIYALIYPLILNMSIKSILLVFQGLPYHKPKFYFKLGEVKEFIVFGLYQMGSGIVNYFNSQFDIIIIGKVFGNETLGLYSVAKQLVMRPAQIINPVMTRVSFPIMAKVQQDMSRLKDIYLKTINYLSSINFPIYIAMIILAPELVGVFLGEKWMEIVSIFQVLSIYALIRSTGNPVGSLILARGKPEYGFYWTLALFAISPIWIYVSTFYGIDGVVWGLVLLMIVLLVPNWYFLVKKLCGATFIEYFLQILKPLIISSVSGVGVYLVLEVWRTTSIFLNILIVLVVGLVILTFMNLSFNKSFVHSLKDLFFQKRKGKK